MDKRAFDNFLKAQKLTVHCFIIRKTFPMYLHGVAQKGLSVSANEAPLRNGMICKVILLI
jgi:hypothetical protein